MILLEKINDRGKKQYWMASVNENIITYRWGQQGGKQQVKDQLIANGKNIGRSNETTPEQQALLEMVVKARKKVDTGYKIMRGEELIETNTNDNVTKTNLEIPKPMLANKYVDHKKKFEGKSFFCQPKLDGNRALINIRTGQIFSRSRKEIISVPHIGEEIKEKFSKLFDNDIEWFDGELYSHDLTFNEMQSIIRKNKVETIDFENSKKISFYIFDYVSEETFVERLERMSNFFNAVEELEYTKLVPSFFIKDTEIDTFHNQFIADGYEGIMLRFPYFSYQQKRSLGLFKYKNFFDEEYEVVGFNSQEYYPDKLGTIDCIDKNNGNVFPATPAMTQEEKDYIWHNQDLFLGKLATVRYQEKFEDTNVPRFGVIKNFRDSSDL